MRSGALLADKDLAASEDVELSKFELISCSTRIGIIDLLLKSTISNHTSVVKKNLVFFIREHERPDLLFALLHTSAGFAG